MGLLVDGLCRTQVSTILEVLSSDFLLLPLILLYMDPIAFILDLSELNLMLGINLARALLASMEFRNTSEVPLSYLSEGYHYGTWNFWLVEKCF